jgi:integrase
MNDKTRGYRRGRVYRAKGCKTWRVRYYRHGKEYDETSGSRNKQDAQRLLNARLGEVVSGHFVGPQAEKVTLADLEQMVKDDHALKGRKSPAPLARVLEHFGAKARALDIRPEKVTAYALSRMKAGAAAATARNEVAALHRGFVLAHRAGRLQQVPHFEMPDVTGNARQGFIGDAELQRLLVHLPPYMRAFTEAGYITGMRRGELRNLQWKSVDWQSGTIRLEANETKNRRPRVWPFAQHPRLAELIREQREETTRREKRAGALCEWVFHREGRQVTWYYDGWRSACKRAGLPALLFHDLRRSAIRNMVGAGIGEHVAMTLSGHRTSSTFRRYNIVSGDDQREAVRKLAAHRSGEVEGGHVLAMNSRGRGVE